MAQNIVGSLSRHGSTLKITWNISEDNLRGPQHIASLILIIGYEIEDIMKLFGV